MIQAKDLLDYLKAPPPPLSAPLPAGKVHYGLADGIDPPLLSVTDFKAVPTYDTAGPSFYTLTCTLIVVHKNQDTAEALMAQYLALLEDRPPVPSSPLKVAKGLMGAVVDDYAVAQSELFVFEVTASLTLTVQRVE